MSIKKLLLTAIVFSFIFSTCKKKSDDDDTTPTPTPTPTPPTSVLCNGNGSTSYFPIDIGNEWKFTDSGSEVVWTISDTVRSNGHLFFKIEDVWDEFFYSGAKIRQDSTTSDIYLDNYLYIPANPVVGTTYPYVGSTSRKVASLTASITTDSCSYSNLLEMDEIITSSGVVNRRYYYKKGIGSVAYRDTLFGVPRPLNLKKVTLN